MKRSLNNNAGNYSKSYEDDLRPYFKRWYWFLISLILCLGFCWIYLFFEAPSYKVSATLYIPDDKLGGGLLKATAFSDLNMFHQVKTIDNETEVLRSKDLIARVLKQLNLDVAYFLTSGLKDVELYGRTNPIKIEVLTKAATVYQQTFEVILGNADSITVGDGIIQHSTTFGQIVTFPGVQMIIYKGLAKFNRYQKLHVKFKNVSEMADAYSIGKIKIVPVVKESNTLMLTTTDVLPQRGIDILTNLINLYNKTTLEKKNNIALQTIKFLDERLAAMETDLSSTEKNIATFKQDNNTSDVSADGQINLEKSAEYSRLIEESEVQLGVVKQTITYLRSSKNEYNLMPSTSGLKDAVLLSLVNRFNDLQIERDRLLRNMDITNPIVQNVTGQLGALRSSIIENLNNIQQSLLIENRHLKTNLSRYNSRLFAAPTIERSLLNRGREQGVKTNLYQYFLQKREETALSLMANVPVSEVVDRPSYNSKPVMPKYQLTYLAGAILAFILPFGGIYANRKFWQKLEDSEDIKAIQGVKILGELCHNKKRDNIVMTPTSRSTISELFRYIKTNFSILNENNEPKTILVTSCSKGEGKTFFCINMGLTMAVMNKKVVLLEFDLRKPDLLKKMGLPERAGIAEYLRSEIDDVARIARPYHKNPNLYTISCGHISENPAELFESFRINDLFKSLKQKFDYVIIDSSPVGAVADAFNLSRYADNSVYLVRYNYTTGKQLNVLRDINTTQKLNNIMVVLNDARPENRPVYGYAAAGYNHEVC